MTVQELISHLESLPESEKALPIKVGAFDNEFATTVADVLFEPYLSPSGKHIIIPSGLDVK